MHAQASLLNPQAVAVVGASQRVGRASFRCAVEGNA
jgi:hypothetical protein